MNTQDRPTSGSGPDGWWAYRVAGIAAAALAAGYLVAIPVYALVGDQPATGLERSSPTSRTTPPDGGPLSS